MNNDDYALLTDLYQLTMAQGYWSCGKLDEEGCFHVFFRETPVQGGFAIASGLDHVAEVIENFSFSDESIAYLSKAGSRWRSAVRSGFSRVSAHA